VSEPEVLQFASGVEPDRTRLYTQLERILQSPLPRSMEAKLHCAIRRRRTASPLVALLRNQATRTLQFV